MGGHSESVRDWKFSDDDRSHIDGLLVDSGNAGSAQTTYTKYLQPQVSCGWGNLSSSLAPHSMGNIGTRGSLAPP